MIPLHGLDRLRVGTKPTPTGLLRSRNLQGVVGAPLVGALQLWGCCEALTAMGKNRQSVENPIPRDAEKCTNRQF